MLALTSAQTNVVLGGGIGLVAGVAAAVVAGWFAARNANRDRRLQLTLAHNRWLDDRWGETDVELCVFLQRWAKLADDLWAGRLTPPNLKTPKWAKDWDELTRMQTRVRLYAFAPVKAAVAKWLDARAAFWTEWGNVLNTGASVNRREVYQAVERLKAETDNVIETIGRGE